MCCLFLLHASVLLRGQALGHCKGSPQESTHRVLRMPLFAFSLSRVHAAPLLIRLLLPSFLCFRIPSRSFLSHAVLLIHRFPTLSSPTRKDVCQDPRLILKNLFRGIALIQNSRHVFCIIFHPPPFHRPPTSTVHTVHAPQAARSLVSSTRGTISTAGTFHLVASLTILTF